MTELRPWRGRVLWGLLGWLLPVVAGAAALPSLPFEAPGTLQALKLRGITARPAALMLSGQSGGPLPLAMVAVPLPGATPPFRVAVVVEIPASALAFDASSGEGQEGKPEERIEMYLYALDTQGKPAATWAQVFRPPAVLVPAAEKAAQSPAGAKVFLHLELPTGRFELRLLVIALPSGRFGLIRGTVEVPGGVGSASSEETSAEAPSVGSRWTVPPLVADPAPERWTLVREAPHGSFPTGQMPYPFRAGGEAFVPSARPVLTDGEEVAVHLLSAGQAMGGAKVIGRLEDGEGLARGELRGGAFRTSGSAEVPWQWSSGALQTASPHLGPAQLIVLLGEEETPPLEVLVARPRASGEPILWPDLLGEAQASASPGGGSPGSPAAPVETKERLGRGEIRRIADAYRGALGELAEGRPAKARQQLVELEAGIVEGRSLGAVDALREAELAALPEAVKASPRLLLPIARLHLDLLELYTRDVRSLLAVHARTQVRQLLGLFAAAADNAEARRLGADLFARFGDSLQKMGLRSEAAESFRSALALVSDHRPSLLALGALLERAGQARQAAEVLAPLRQLLPEDAESCLRLGRSQQQQGRAGDAKATLEACIRLRQPAWAVVVAFEELTKLEVAAERWAAAEAVSRQGAERFPGERSLVLQWVYLLDRLDRPEEAGRILAGLDRSPRDSRESPRARYGQWPEEIFARLSRETDAALEEILPLLARSLGEPSRAGQAGS
jgi:tetratricopeptide (TPR) repeat protein